MHALDSYCAVVVCGVWCVVCGVWWWWWCGGGTGTGNGTGTGTDTAAGAGASFFFSPSIETPGEVIVDHITNLLGREEPGRRRIGDGVVVRGRDGVVVRGRGLRVVRGRGLVVRSVPGFFVLVVRGRGLCVVVVFALRGVVFAAQQRPQHTNAFIADCFIHGTWDWC